MTQDVENTITGCPKYSPPNQYKPHHQNTITILIQAAKMKAFIFMAVLLTILSRGGAAAAVACPQIEGALAPCIGYLIGQDGGPSPPCCDGVKAVKGMAQTTPDKRAACNCIKAAANRYTNLKDDAAQSLPDKCGVKLDVPVSRTVDCHKIN
ncbi:non-specific lipid-transfer protein 1-like [Andrographis paniculata]|uniref:non-specific lipid-transfer protein 1-like n=1 Tax=Andrographis paniculata TaxID=175694 RepID=UPI0021E939A6|nr:non-specific lipid-transfer protein 1-like [Andrographis paniculata]